MTVTFLRTKDLPEHKPLPPWIWLLVGMGIGIGGAELVHFLKKPASTHEDAVITPIVEKAQPAPSVPSPKPAVKPVVPTPPSAPIPTPTPPPAPTPAPVRVATPPPAAPAPEAPKAAGAARTGPAELLAEAKQLRDADQYQDARARCETALAVNPDPSLKAELETLLGDIHIGLLFSARAMPEKSDYTVVSGDSLDRLAKKFSTNVDLIRKSNNLTSPNIRIGNRMRIFTGRFQVYVDKSDNTLTLFMNDKFFKRYRVGTGQYNKTPVGTFKVTDRIAQPTWWKPDGKAVPYGDPENLLGTHWLAIDVPGYGIHGTWEPNTIGTQSSAGCVRLLNPDVEELYTLLPIGTPVTIQD